MKNSKDVGEALARIHTLISSRHDIHIIQTSELSRVDRELLMRKGWLQEIIQGWYLLVRPDICPGDSSGWYATFWDFLYVYLTHFYRQDYCLSAEHSLDLHLGMTSIPQQVVVMAPKGRGAPLKLLFDTSLLIYASEGPPSGDKEVLRRLQVMSLPYALCKVAPIFFQLQPCEAEIALQSIKSSDDLFKGYFAV